jgi:alpha-glucosidase
LFEVPVRPHTENLCNCKQTAPNRIGHLESNSENVLLRQSLTPYYYSLAFEAWLSG